MEIESLARSGRQEACCSSGFRCFASLFSLSSCVMVARVGWRLYRRGELELGEVAHPPVTTRWAAAAGATSAGDPRP